MDSPHQALFSMRGKVAVVTGGSGVLGGALARGLASADAQVAVLGRREDRCRNVAEEITAAGGIAMGLGCDVLDRASLEHAAAEIERIFGPADILVNAAGGNAPEASTSATRSFFDLESADLEAVFRLNLTGTVSSSQVFGSAMAQRGEGVVITIASMAAIRPLTRIVAYSAAKAALVNFTQWLAVHMAREYSPRIRVNAIAPGFFLTGQNRFLLTDPATGAWTERGTAIVAHTPMGRLGEPDDLLGTLLWLASPASAFVTGAIIPVDGGFSAYGGV